MANFSPHRLIVESPFLAKSTISCGLIVHSNATGRWIITQRRHSVEITIIMRGLYRATYLPFYMLELPLAEAKLLAKCLGLDDEQRPDEQNPGKFIFSQQLALRVDEDAFRHLFLNILGLPPAELSYGLTRLQDCQEQLRCLLHNIDFSRNIPQWIWPKGRIEFKENSFACAAREFREEVGTDLPPALYISKEYINHTIRTHSGRVLESRYFIYIVDEEFTIQDPIDHPEVSARKWATEAEVQTLIAHPDLFYRVKADTSYFMKCIE